MGKVVERKIIVIFGSRGTEDRNSRFVEDFYKMVGVKFREILPGSSDNIVLQAKAASKLNLPEDQPPEYPLIYIIEYSLADKPAPGEGSIAGLPLNKEKFKVIWARSRPSHYDLCASVVVKMRGSPWF
jgi:hypothetical protein